MFLIPLHFILLEATRLSLSQMFGCSDYFIFLPEPPVFAGIDRFSTGVLAFLEEWAQAPWGSAGVETL
jgi:hypothetical protein